MLSADPSRPIAADALVLAEGAETADAATSVLSAAVECHRRPAGVLLLLVLTGDLVLSTVAQLAPTTVALISDASSIGRGQHLVIVDLAGLVLIDSAGLNALTELRQLILRGGGSFCMLRPRPQASRLLELSGAGEVITVCRDLAEALRRDP